MVDVTYFNMLLNIGLLVLIAALLTNLEFVRTLFLEEQSSIFSKTALAVIFGIISIVSTYFARKWHEEDEDEDEESSQNA